MGSRYLTKSRYTLGLQCLKAMWLSVWKPTLATPFDEATNHRFLVGTCIGEYARKRFPDGVLVLEDHMHLKEAIVSKSARWTVALPPDAVAQNA